MGPVRSTVGGEEGIPFQELKEDTRGGGERAALVVGEIEIPAQVEPLDLDHYQLSGIDLLLNGEPREERSAEATSDRIFDGRIAAQFEGDVQIGNHDPGPLQ